MCEAVLRITAAYEIAFIPEDNTDLLKKFEDKAEGLHYSINHLLLYPTGIIYRYTQGRK